MDVKTFANKKVSYQVVYILCIYSFFFFLKKTVKYTHVHQVMGHRMDAKLSHANYSIRDEI